jgi:hypothetical protein
MDDYVLMNLSTVSIRIRLSECSDTTRITFRIDYWSFIAPSLIDKQFEQFFSQRCFSRKVFFCTMPSLVGHHRRGCIRGFIQLRQLAVAAIDILSSNASISLFRFTMSTAEWPYVCRSPSAVLVHFWYTLQTSRGSPRITSCCRWSCSKNWHKFLPLPCYAWYPCCTNLFRKNKHDLLS